MFILFWFCSHSVNKKYFSSFIFHLYKLIFFFFKCWIPIVDSWVRACKNFTGDLQTLVPSKCYGSCSFNWWEACCDMETLLHHWSEGLKPELVFLKVWNYPSWAKMSSPPTTPLAKSLWCLSITLQRQSRFQAGGS